MTKDANKNCSSLEAQCTFLTLNGCQFMDNKASTSGGAIFTSNPETVRYHCPPAVTHPDKPSSDELLVSMERMHSKTPLCEEWTNNTATVNGDFIVKAPGGIKVFLLDERGERIKEISDNKNYEFEDHRSGNLLPPMELVLVDDDGNIPPLNEMEIPLPTAILESPGLFEGNVTLNFEENRCNVSNIIGLGRLGTYVVTIRFSPLLLESISYKVTILECRLGEESLLNETMCRTCSLEQYRTARGQSCTLCPSNANCSGSFILPIPGHWSPDPCSDKIDRCLSPSSCSFEDRWTKLENTTKSQKECPSKNDNDMFKKDFQKDQCAPVRRFASVLWRTCVLRDMKVLFVGLAKKSMDKQMLSNVKNVKIF